MGKIWVIEQGCYSDYRVVGVYSSRENAEIVCREINKSELEEATIDEWTLDPGVEDVNAGHTGWIVTMLKDGSTERAESHEIGANEIAGNIWMWNRPAAPYNKGKPNPPPAILSAVVWAKDLAHALKIVNEHRIRMIANGEWPLAPVTAGREG